MDLTHEGMNMDDIISVDVIYNDRNWFNSS